MELYALEHDINLLDLVLGSDDNGLSRASSSAIPALLLRKDQDAVKMEPTVAIEQQSMLPHGEVFKRAILSSLAHSLADACHRMKL